MRTGAHHVPRRTARTPVIVDSSPSRYVARVDRATGREIPGAILPEELLVDAHRDHHPLGIAVQLLASRLVELTGGEWLARHSVRALNQLGRGLAAGLGALGHLGDVEGRARKILGVSRPDFFFRFREPTSLSAAEREARVAALRADGRKALKALGPKPLLRVLLTGATGFLGKEVLVQALEDKRVAEIVCLLRPERAREGRTGRANRPLGARARGARLLAQLAIAGPAARRVRFIAGDVETPGMGIGSAENERLRRTLTHVVHCAASVAFDGGYESLFRANVLGSLNAMAFSLEMQSSPGSPFVAHVALETSYIHGRVRREAAREHGLVFPGRYYNNFYELTKAMASIEADRAMFERGLRVSQLLPSIVIGGARTGNNRGDTKVVNAPVNAFGRVKGALDAARGCSLGMRLRASLVASIGTRFPADPSAELNLVTVDRVVAGILAALTAPQAIGARIHLASDRRIRSAEISRVIREELEIDLQMADPTLTRLFTRPLATALLGALGEEKLAQAFARLAALFGGYSEWGQPVHEVGDDVAILSLPAQRPDTIEAFRMLCRHSRFVQEFGAVRDPKEIARRERLWARAIDDIEFGTGRRAASMPADVFQRLVAARIDLHGFEERSPC